MQLIADVAELPLRGAISTSSSWSTRSTARATGMSQSSVSRIWRAFGIQSHRSASFRLVHRPAVHPRPYVWVKTADQILASLARYRVDLGLGRLAFLAGIRR
jgi:hypothetical protein